ncbi:MAG: SHOCT domain-containing protein [Actinomycetales bacterium]|nr:SHOCT domain-containing protein [Actinomycetales bacterium]
MGRPGLVGTMARTAVIAGTASAVSGNVQRRQATKYAEQAYPPPAPVAPAPAAAPAPAPAPAPADAMMAQLVQLGEMRNQGLLSDAEFAAAKARLLSS